MGKGDGDRSEATTGHADPNTRKSCSQPNSNQHPKFDIFASHGIEPVTTKPAREETDIPRNYRINHRIRAPEVLLVQRSSNGAASSNVMRRNEALSLAQDMGLDLVEVGPDQNPPVVRLMDYGKFKFDQSKRAKEARKASRATSQLKKVRLTAKIADNDIAQKTKRVLQFLQDGAKVQVFVRFRGREQAHPEIAMDVLRRVAKGVATHARLEQKPVMEGRMLSMLLAPRTGQTQPRPSNNSASADRRHRKRRENGAPVEKRDSEPIAQTV